jgi:methylthioribose-1-phosphate isomerase
MVIGVQEATTPDLWLEHLHKAGKALSASRPTAVNLQVGVQKMIEVGLQLANQGHHSFHSWTSQLLDAANQFHREDEILCERIGAHGAALLPDGACILTHCNAGALATGGMGTALSVIYSAFQNGNPVTVLADETRPLLQGARLTCWELSRAGIPVTLQCDSAAASALASGNVHAVVVGSDRIARNGDVANKIGTYGLAVLAHHHDVPFYVAAPTTTVDLNCPTGATIPIEERGAEEILGFGNTVSAPGEVPVRNPAFDVTPAALVTAIITEHGVLHAPSEEKLLAQAETKEG